MAEVMQQDATALSPALIRATKAPLLSPAHMGTPFEAQDAAPTSMPDSRSVQAVLVAEGLEQGRGSLSKQTVSSRLHGNHLPHLLLLAFKDYRQPANNTRRICTGSSLPCVGWLLWLWPNGYFCGRDKCIA